MSTVWHFVKAFAYGVLLTASLCLATFCCLHKTSELGGPMLAVALTLSSLAVVAWSFNKCRELVRGGQR